VSDFQVLAFAKLAQDIGIDNIVGLSLGAWTRGYTTPQGAAVLLADPDAIRDAIRALYGEDGAQPPEPGATVAPVDPGIVEVQNGAGVEGLAAAVARYIVAKGVDPEDVVTGNATDGLSHTRTEIIALDGRLEAATRIAEWLGLDASHVRAATAGDEVTPSNPGASIVVILGTDLDTTRFVEAG
jgi:hypothetical protein